MKEKTKIILTAIISVTVTLSITAYAVFSTSAEHITLDIDKTEKENVKESLDELYDMAGGSGCEEGKICLGSLETTNSTKKCRRAKSLHTEICTQTSTSEYCSSTNTSYNGTDIKNKDTIIYGNTLITQGELHAGDAFTCDVNGDGIYDEETERFYYVSDLYTGGVTDSETFDTNYAVLIYYNNTTAGVADNTSASLVAYNSANVNNLGPVTGVANLPSTTQWSNINLKTQTRQIYSHTGTTSTSAGTISSYTYTNKAARLITYQEIQQACGTSTNVGTTGYLDTPTCRFLLENTKYSNSSMRTYGYWLETPLASHSSNVWYVRSHLRYVYNWNAYSTSISGVRPAIEVLKSDISY